jgi:hypothetical protein
VAQALREHGEAVAREILATDFAEGQGGQAVELNGTPVDFSIEKRKSD